MDDFFLDDFLLDDFFLDDFFLDDFFFLPFFFDLPPPNNFCSSLSNSSVAVIDIIVSKLFEFSLVNIDTNLLTSLLFIFFELISEVALKPLNPPNILIDESQKAKEFGIKSDVVLLELFKLVTLKSSITELKVLSDVSELSNSFKFPLIKISDIYIYLRKNLNFFLNN